MFALTDLNEGVVLNSPVVVFAFSLATLFLVSAPAWSAPPSYNLQAGIASESFDPGDSDTYTQLTGSMRYNKSISRHVVTNWNMDLYTRRYDESDSRDRNGILLEFIYNFVPSGGFTKPVYSLGLRHEIEKFDQSANDAEETTLLLASTLRLDDSLTVTGGVEVAQRASDVAESDFVGVFVNLDKRLSRETIIYTNLKIQGEESSLLSSAGSGTGSRTAARAEIAGSHLPGEPGYTGPDLPGSSDGSDTTSDNIFITLGINYFMDSHSAIDLSIESIEYDGESSIQADVISLDYFYKF